MYKIVMGRLQTNKYPEWVERYREKGRTIRKVRDGFGLFRVSSEVQKDGTKKVVQEYLGMITQDQGFVPKKGTKDSRFLEYGLSHLICINFGNDLKRSTFMGNMDLVKLGIIRYIFGDVDDESIRSSLLTYRDCERLSELARKISPNQVETMDSRIEDLLKKRIKQRSDLHAIVHTLLMCHAEILVDGIKKTSIPERTLSLLKKYDLKI